MGVWGEDPETVGCGLEGSSGNTPYDEDPVHGTVKLRVSYRAIAVTGPSMVRSQ